MHIVMDRLYNALTALDGLIRRQRRAMATVDAMSNLSDLETARDHVRKAQIVLAHFQGDALPPEAPPPTTQTPGAAPQRSRPS